MMQILAQPVGPDDHSRGPAHAPITLVEYGDYECPDCRLAYLVLADVLQELGDAVRFVFRNYPQTKEHPHAISAALAAESVGARGGEDAFWSMHDLLYENQDALQDDDLVEYAAASGVDPIAVADDLSTGASREPGPARHSQRPSQRRSTHADILRERPTLRRRLERSVGSCGRSPGRHPRTHSHTLTESGFCWVLRGSAGFYKVRSRFAGFC